MHSLLAWAEEQMTAFRGLVKSMVECESPSDDANALLQFGRLLTAAAETHHARTTWREQGHLEYLWGQGEPRILVLAHSDTVWPAGTLQSMPFREARGRLCGPGVLDMKGGIALFLFAMRAVRDLGMRLPGTVLLQVNADEEIGSPSSRKLTEQNALQSRAVLVLEPGTGLAGRLKTERKGVGNFRIEVEGKASHAGVDFEQGASAVVELARQIQKIAGWTDLARGLTVNPGVITGGTRSNVVAANAAADVDFRVTRLVDAIEIEKRFRNLAPVDKRCSITVTGGLNRPPMERSEAGSRLFQLARESAEELGFVVEESSTGGGSDGNFTAALGIPTLDGMGCVGEGAHSPEESIILEHVPRRIALLALLLSKLAADK